MNIVKILLTANFLTNVRLKNLLPVSKKLFFFENNFFQKRIYNTINSERNYYHVKKEDLCSNVIIIPLYKDNYAYIFYDNKNEGIAVDPNDYKIINEIAEKENITIKNVLCTHKHSDHNSGNHFFYNKKINVYGIKESDNKYINKNIQNKQNVQNMQNVHHFEIKNFKITTFLSNFHCINHVAYLVEHSKNKLKKLFFTGDFLFICGIGKNFQADSKDLYNSINNLKKLDKGNIYIFCGHEYTLDNVKFALTVDPTNHKLTEFYQRLLKNENNLPTVPSLLEEEYSYNPFLRCDQDENIKNAIHTYAKRNNYVIERNSDYITLLRIMKDNFKIQ
ncbi:targeted glyoxalase II [Plasmodium brasilianum]|uniref:Targeted glyoxalase II, putative n=2 Tax=Plasmodium (Plasmodium) TaxID=418103 RepID=A0A1A8XAC9_PLAMA|nr:targeted glyoxalase II, putative [Plasmodium malariae]KAI4835585.1 targeted glyoxalase II [Plasmodium brasilianum]SBT00780.1 targeted glyoxalase II, putative [Plasmodium malariae]SBT71958.1 targeted glyoxalase II, putative [Plasmodium malariae]SCP02510.1 targeted glyoxalase II, putative [Plasmodium malariae]